MVNRELSPREAEIVQLSVEGLTNDAIANKLHISLGTVNTYWLRIKLKVGGFGKTDTVVKVIQERADKSLRDANFERESLVQMIADKEHGILELRAALALFHLAMDQIKSTVWATDQDLVIHIIANGDAPSTHCGVVWDIGKNVYEIFKTKSTDDKAIAAHLAALEGKTTDVRLEGEFANMLLRVKPLLAEDNSILGCISVLNIVG